MSRSITDDILPEKEDDNSNSDINQVSNDDIMDFMDQLALLVRDLDTRLSTLERHLLTPKA
jgi:hypothetical protein